MGSDHNSERNNPGCWNLKISKSPKSKTPKITIPKGENPKNIILKKKFLKYIYLQFKKEIYLRNVKSIAEPFISHFTQ